jgi:hypothetical protein
MSSDPFLAQLEQENRLAQAIADAAREQGDTALADQIERDEAERTIQALLGHGYQI